MALELVFSEMEFVLEFTAPVVDRLRAPELGVTSS